jgi:predicted porin
MQEKPCGRTHAAAADRVQLGSITGNVKWGLGAQYDFSKSTALRAEWERFENVVDTRTGEADVDLISVGLQVRF